MPVQLNVGRVVAISLAASTTQTLPFNAAAIQWIVYLAGGQTSTDFTLLTLIASGTPTAGEALFTGTPAAPSNTFTLASAPPAGSVAIVSAVPAGEIPAYP